MNKINFNMMKKINKFLIITLGVLTFYSCSFDDTAQDLLASDLVAGGPYYFQFANASKSLKTGVAPSGDLVEIEESIDVVLLGAPLSEDVTVNLAVDPSTTISSSMYSLSAESVTILAGETSGSITVTSVASAMPQGETLKLVLNLDAGDYNATAGTTLTYDMLRIVYCPIATGTWTINGTDDWGDGWNDGTIVVNINDVITNYTLADGSVYSATIDVPSDTTKLEFSWQQGAWDSEVIFTITDPLGRVVLSVQYPTSGGDLGYEPCDWVD